MLEPQAMDWLRENKIPVPEFRVVTSTQEAITASRSLGYPVVMKVVAREMLNTGAAEFHPPRSVRGY